MLKLEWVASMGWVSVFQRFSVSAFQRVFSRPGVGFVHSSLRQDASLEAGEGANRLTKHAPATRCRKHDGSTLANLPAGDTPRVSLRSPVREYCTPGSVRGGAGQPVSLPRHHYARIFQQRNQANDTPAGQDARLWSLDTFRRLKRKLVLCSRTPAGCRTRQQLHCSQLALPRIIVLAAFCNGLHLLQPASPLGLLHERTPPDYPARLALVQHETQGTLNRKPGFTGLFTSRTAPIGR